MAFQHFFFLFLILKFILAQYDIKGLSTLKQRIKSKEEGPPIMIPEVC